MKKLLKSKKALSPVVAAIILIAVTVAVSIAVAAWMGSLTIGFMNTKEAKITSVTFHTLSSTDYINFTITNTGTTKVNIDTIKVNDLAVQVGNIYNGTTGVAFTAADIPIGIEAGANDLISVEVPWTAGAKYSVSLLETDGTLVGSYTATA